MSKGTIIILIGLFTAFLPFTGFPTNIKTVLAILFGLSIMALGFLAREERGWLVRAIKGGHSTDSYTENNPHHSAFLE
jgi:hypothetical protein